MNETDERLQRQWAQIESNRRADKIVRRRKIAQVTGGCDRCPPHAKENARLKGRKPREDKHKNHRTVKWSSHHSVPIY